MLRFSFTLTQNVLKKMQQTYSNFVIASKINSGLKFHLNHPLTDYSNEILSFEFSENEEKKSQNMLSAAIVIGAFWANFGPIIDSQLHLKKISFTKNQRKILLIAIFILLFFVVS